jgi:hypothetical protein
MKTENTKEFAKQWIENSYPCKYRYGFAFRGASSRDLSKEEALKLLPKYDFGKSFYQLAFCRDRRVTDSGSNYVSTECYGDIVLMFNEYSANDMW